MRGEDFFVDTSPFKRQEWLPLNCCSRGGAAVASTLSTCLASESRSWTGCSVVELNGVRAPRHWLGSRPLTLRARWPSRWVVAHNGPRSKWELRTQAQPCGRKTRSDGLSLIARTSALVLGTCVRRWCGVSPSSVPECW